MGLTITVYGMRTFCSGVPNASEDDLAKAGWQVKFRTPELHAARLRRHNLLAQARLDALAPASDWERRHLGGALPRQALPIYNIAILISQFPLVIGNNGTGNTSTLATILPELLRKRHAKCAILPAWKNRRRTLDRLKQT